MCRRRRDLHGVDRHLDLEIDGFRREALDRRHIPKVDVEIGAVEFGEF